MGVTVVACIVFSVALVEAGVTSCKLSTGSKVACSPEAYGCALLCQGSVCSALTGCVAEEAGCSRAPVTDCCTTNDCTSKATAASMARNGAGALQGSVMVIFVGALIILRQIV